MASNKHPLDSAPSKTDTPKKQKSSPESPFGAAAGGTVAYTHDDMSYGAIAAAASFGCAAAVADVPAASSFGARPSTCAHGPCVRPSCRSPYVPPPNATGAPFHSAAAADSKANELLSIGAKLAKHAEEVEEKWIETTAQSIISEIKAACDWALKQSNPARRMDITIGYSSDYAPPGFNRDLTVVSIYARSNAFGRVRAWAKQNGLAVDVKCSCNPAIGSQIQCRLGQGGPGCAPQVLTISWPNLC